MRLRRPQAHARDSVSLGCGRNAALALWCDTGRSFRLAHMPWSHVRQGGPFEAVTVLCRIRRGRHFVVAIALAITSADVCGLGAATYRAEGTRW